MFHLLEDKTTMCFSSVIGCFVIIVSDDDHHVDWGEHWRKIVAVAAVDGRYFVGSDRNGLDSHRLAYLYSFKTMAETTEGKRTINTFSNGGIRNTTKG